MASLSNLPDAIARIQDYEYLYASNTNVSNFISVKLSGYGNYDLWKTQMLCLMEAHEMCWLVDDSTQKDLSKNIIKKYDSLLKGWIFGSVSEDVLRIVVNPTYSAKDVWEKLISSFDPTMSSKQERYADSSPAKLDTTAKAKDSVGLGETSNNDERIESSKSAKGEEIIQIGIKDSASTKEDTKATMALGETTTDDEGNNSTKPEVKEEDATKKDSEPVKVDNEIEIEAENTETENNKLRQLIMDEKYRRVYNELKSRNALKEKIDSDGNTILHIAATVGEKDLVESVISSHKNLLHIKDNEGKTPLDKAYENMHLDIIAYLEGAAKDDEICKKGAETETKDLPQLIADGDWYAVYLKSGLLSEEINSDGNTLLHIAAEIGDCNLISAILWRQPSCNWTNIKNKHGSTVLHMAAIAGNTNGAELLVKHNKMLLEIQDNEGRTPLDKASENGNLNTVRYLKEAANKGANRVTNKLQQLIVDQDWVGVYLELGTPEVLTKKINSNGNTLLHIAVEIGNDMLISEILGLHDHHYRSFSLYDLDLTNIKNYDGSTVLHIAAIVGNTSAAKILIKTNKRLLDIPDNEGKTPLGKANEAGHVKTISYLRKATNFQKLIVDGDWFKVYTKLRKRNALTENIDGDGNTLLHKVVEISRNDLVKRILSHIREHDLTEIRSSNGSTVLHIAAIVGNTDAIVLLVKHDRQLLDIRDNEGKTPLDRANGNRHLKDTIANVHQVARITEATELRQLVVDGDWYQVIVKLYKRKALKEKINSNGNTLLHILVGMGDDFLIKATLRRISDHDLTTIKNAEGSTVLHIAAIVGNPNTAKSLVKENKNLLYTEDNDGKTPLDKAYENMHLDTIAYLLEAMEDNEKGKEEALEASTVHPRRKKDADVEIGVDLLANAISAKRYDVALNLIGKYPEYTVFNNNVLMAMARTFPAGLDYGERLIYPNLDNTREMILGGTKNSINSLAELSSDLKESTWSFLRCEYGFLHSVSEAFFATITILAIMGNWIYMFIPLFLAMVYFPLFGIYLALWNAAARVVPFVMNIEQKKKEHKEAKEVLELLLKTIIEEHPDSSPDLYTTPILEAACQDAYEVVDQILGRWPEAIHCKDKFGYDIIQLATIHRSERIYNMIYIIGERKNIYRTIQDSSKNNMLHLVGRLAPSNKLKRRRGAALQLQRELQWRQEVEKLVFPTFFTKENIFMETPEMVFTKEHETLVKEGEKWIKAVAESCSITAALITTIVFAAAITVPGGSNQDTGIPVFTKQAAFTLFAIADAISLFSSTTSLLVFLSILTARFAEQDFLVRLPRRLIIGLCTLLISTTAMMVAFSATLFLVFSQQKLWVLGPICAFALLPVAFFFVLQFPLILDLLQSTYIFKFGKNDDETSKFVQNNIQFMFS